MVPAVAGTTLVMSTMTSSTSADALKNFQGTLVLAGAGKMGGAMLSGWLAQELDAKRVVVIEPHPSDETRGFAARGVRLNPETKDIRADVLVVAVKPQMFRDAGPQLKALANPSTLVVSIMAGATIAGITEVCGGKVIRAMPNTPRRYRTRHHRGGRDTRRRAGTTRGRERTVARHRQRRMDRRRSADGRGHCVVRFGSSLRVPARGRTGARRRRGRPAGRARNQVGARNRSRFGRTAAPARISTARPCARTSLRPAAPPLLRSMC